MSKLISLLILILIPLLSKTQKNTLKENQSLKTSFYDSSLQRYNAINLFSGIGKDNKSDKIPLEINIGYRKVLIGDISKIDWGIRCDKSYINTCELKSSRIEIDSYYNKSFSFSQAEVYTRFLREEELFASGIPKLKINLVSKAEDWPIGKLGVIGLHQHGDFISFIKQVYPKQDFFFLLSFKSEEKDMVNKRKMNMEMVIDPSFKKEDERISLEFDENRRNLEISASFFFKNNEEEENILLNEDLCFSSVGESLFHLENADILCNKLKKKICKDANNCKEDTANFDEASIIELKINDINFSFDHKEYFYYDEEKFVQCRFEEYNLKSQGVCSIVTSFAIGKGFIEKYSLVLGYKSNGKNSILILNSKQDKKGSIWIWLLLGFIASVISFIVLVYACFIKKKEDDDYELYIPIEK